MKRRTFVLLSVAGAASLGIPFVNCRQRNPALIKTLSIPLFLSRICDAKTINGIGEAYRHQVTEEAKEHKLADVLLLGPDGKPVQSSDQAFLQSMMEKKITQDFEVGNTVTVNGWVLAVTEARQCALYSLSQQQ